MADSASELVDHLFRRQSAKMVAVLVRILGTRNVELAEDVVQDVLCRALETWKFAGPPPNPEGWLMQAAKHRAIDLIRRRNAFSELSPELGRLFESEWTLAPTLEASFENSAIRDGELRLMFSCCDPTLSPDARIAVILKYLCGFSVREIARAFLTSEDTVEKRLGRARAALKAGRVLFQVDAVGPALERLPSVLRALYLLFNEGYHGANEEVSVRAELCLEALRLSIMLTEHDALATAETAALVSMMCLHGARLPARVDEDQCLVALTEQDRSRWNRDLIERGLFWLARSARGEIVSEYHLEAAIAGHHAVAESVEQTNWAAIVELYDALYRIKVSPVVALNRAIALGMADGPGAGLRALEQIPDRGALERYPFYEAALGDMNLRLGSAKQACAHFTRARALARNPKEVEFLERRLLNARRRLD